MGKKDFRFSVASIREIEHYCFNTLKLSELTLMRCAGTQAWQLLQKYFPNAKRIIILAGPGNNGGDAYILAAHALRANKKVSVYRGSKNVASTSVAQKAYEEFLQEKGVSHLFSDELPEADVIVDALFGIGLTRPIEGAYAHLIAVANQHSAPIFSLDCPSGLDADTGSVLGVAITAQTTATFIAYKKGLCTKKSIPFVGQLVLCDLDLPENLMRNFRGQ